MTTFSGGVSATGAEAGAAVAPRADTFSIMSDWGSIDVRFLAFEHVRCKAVPHGAEQYTETSSHAGIRIERKIGDLS